MDVFSYHKGGKLKIIPSRPIKGREELSLAYTPGVAEISKAIIKEEEKAYEYTLKGKTVGVISNGTAVLGLGDIGALASLPVMEGKAMLMYEFGGVQAFPVVVDEKDPDKFVEIVSSFAKQFAAINLEDIKAPDCFYIEEELERRLDIPVFHDDQHGSSIAVLAGLYNALKIVGKGKDVRIVINGAGAAGLSTAKLLYQAGFRDMVVLDSKGSICLERKDLNPYKYNISTMLGIGECVPLREALKGADVFIGLSKGEILKAEDVGVMNDDAVVFALANPTPELTPEEAEKAKRSGKLRIYATGRSDLPNQINNALVFPALFRAIVELRLRKTPRGAFPKIAELISSYIEPKEDNLLPSALDKKYHRWLSERIKEVV